MINGDNEGLMVQENVRIPGIVILAFILHLLFPDIEWLWGSTQ